MPDLLLTGLIALGVGSMVAGLRWRALHRRRVEAQRSLPALPGRDIVFFGFSAGLLVLVVGCARLWLADGAGGMDTLDRGRIGAVALGLFALLAIPHVVWFGPVYRDVDPDYAYFARRFGNGFVSRLRVALADSKDHLGRFNLLLLFIASLMFADVTNRQWDRGAPVHEAMIVTSPADHRRASGRESCLIDLSPAEGGLLRLPFVGPACSAVATGQALSVPVRPGWFGARWVDSGDLADANPP